MPSHREADLNPANLSQMTLAVIAGGKGQRMGLPKSQMQFQKQPILAWLLREMQWPGPTLLVTAPGVTHPPASELFDREAVDPVEGLGPLRGLLTALEESSTPIVVAITVDMPAVRRPMLEWLVAMLAAHAEARGVMCRIDEEHESRIEPFPSAFRRDAREEIAQRLAAGKGSVQTLAAQPGFLALQAPSEWPASTWTNLNTPAELNAFETLHENFTSKEQL